MLLIKSIWTAVIMFIGIKNCQSVEVYYTVSSSSHSVTCPLNVSCLTLQDFASISGKLPKNSHLILLQGNHSLDTDLSLSRIDTLSLVSDTISNSLMVSVTCNSLAKFQLREVTTVTISGIKFVNCVDNYLYAVKNFTIVDSIFTLSDNSRQIVGTGFIMITTNFHARRVLFTLFQGQQWQMYQKLNEEHVISGGALIISSYSNATIFDCEFTENTAAIGGAIFVEYSSIVNITKCNFSENMVNCSGISCGCGGVLFSNSGSKVVVIDSIFANNTVGPTSSGNNGGVFALYNGATEIYQSDFFGNTVAFGGGIVVCETSFVHIESSRFFSNYAVRGGVLYTEYSDVFIHNSVFYTNTAYLGGVIYDMTSTTFNISHSEFSMNVVMAPGGNGGVIFSTESLISINNCCFLNNTAYTNGGVFDASETEIVVKDSNFSNNYAFAGGGAVYKIHDYSILHVFRCSHDENQVERDGGVVNGYASSLVFAKCDFSSNISGNNGGTMFVKACNVTFYISAWFRSNIARSGGTVYSEYGSLQSNGSLSIYNIACVGVIYLIHTQAKFLGSALMYSNSGSLYIFDSQVEISGNLTCARNIYYIDCQCVNHSKECGFQEGGAITVILSRVEMNGMVTIEHNNATRGGGILAVASRLYIAARFEAKRNMATISGGGLYLYQCQLQLLGKIFIEKNTARKLGGAIHSISTSIVLFGTDKPEPTKKSRSKVSIVSNKANMGGGIALEFGSKIYAMAHQKLIIFSKNKAKKGGAIYVANGTNAEACPGLAKAAIDFAVECFFPVDFTIYQDREEKINHI